MRSLIPKIEIGKRYLVTCKVSELACPFCGYHAGANHTGQEIIVTVLMGTVSSISCPKCKRSRKAVEGFYSIILDDKRVFAAPYTWFSRLPDEQYEEEE